MHVMFHTNRLLRIKNAAYGCAKLPARFHLEPGGQRLMSGSPIQKDGYALAEFLESLILIGLGFALGLVADILREWFRKRTRTRNAAVVMGPIR